MSCQSCVINTVLEFSYRSTSKIVICLILKDHPLLRCTLKDVSRALKWQLLFFFKPAQFDGNISINVSRFYHNFIPHSLERGYIFQIIDSLHWSFQYGARVLIYQSRRLIFEKMLVLEGSSKALRMFHGVIRIKDASQNRNLTTLFLIVKHCRKFRNSWA